MRTNFYSQLMRLPQLGKTMRLVASTRFLQALAACVRAGLPIQTGLDLAAGSSQNPLLEEAVRSASEGLKSGAELSEAFKATGFFPTSMVQAIRAGEQSGRLSSMMESICGLLQVELESQCEIFSKAMEPLILSGIGGVVGFCVIATMLPMIKLLQSL